MTVFDGILGQGSAIDAISRAMLGNRLPHGMIFAGPSGVGKRLAAFALAKRLLCERSADLDACNTCASCKLVGNGNHPDLHYIYRQLIRLENSDSKARDLSINVIRPYLLEPAGRKSNLGVGKVFIIEEADSMNASAQNSMLKTLEEPAGKTAIILLTDSPAALLPTIRSRCQLFQFAPLADSMVCEKLIERGTAPELARQAAVLAEGSLGQAIAYMELGIIDKAAILCRSLQSFLCRQPVVEFADQMKTAAKEYATAELARDPLASEDQLNRQGLTLYLNLLANHCRRLMRKGDGRMLDSLCGAIDVFRETAGYVESNVNVALILRQLAVRLESL